jgi:hypothetical protein
MRTSWIRRVMGRSLLRRRSRQRTTAVGDCPRCGSVVLGATECWLDAERILTEHLRTCDPGAAVPAPPRSGRVRGLLRHA